MILFWIKNNQNYVHSLEDQVVCKIAGPGGWIRGSSSQTVPFLLRHYNISIFIFLAEALRGMEAVAGHINEMQKIYEEYGSIFDELMRHYRGNHPQHKVSPV